MHASSNSERKIPYTEVLKGNVLIMVVAGVIRQLSLFTTFPYFSLYVKALGGS